MTEKLRGVNLGGWLVLERWMTPALFEGTDAPDEYSFMQTPGARTKLREHQKNFIREEDFRWLHDHGINAVRIPIGYWIFEGDDPYVSCIGRLDWAVRMAEKYDLKVLICMHGAKGSQNGNDHSGRKGPALWYASNANRATTRDVLVRLTARYADKPHVWGIELLNEPKVGLFQWKLRRFYRQSYRAIQAVGRPGLRVVYSDAFSPRLMSGALRADRSFPIVLDHHWYHGFFPDWFQARLPFAAYEWYMRHVRQPMLERISKAQPVIVGEWNGVIGGGKLNRYPQPEHAAIVRWHIALQVAVYRNLEGWFYWNYKHQDGGVFDFRDMVETGQFPDDLAAQ